MWTCGLFQSFYVFLYVCVLILSVAAGGNAYGKMVQILSFTTAFLDFALHSPKT